MSSLLVASCWVAQSGAADDQERFFEKRIRPLLIENCYECHGPSIDDAAGGLRLDSLAAILRGGESGPAVVPGAPDQSLLIHAVKHDPAVEAMPPDTRLRSDEIASLIRWVEMKVPWPGSRPAEGQERPRAEETMVTETDRAFWAFVAPREPPIPPVENRQWVTSPIDVSYSRRSKPPGSLLPRVPIDLP